MVKKSAVIPIICTQCGNGFSSVKLGAGRPPLVCSYRCRRDRINALRRASPQKRPPMRADICAVCTASFQAYNPKTVTCSARCGGIYSSRLRIADAAQRKARVCGHCNKAFTEGSRSASQLAEGKRQQFCSRSCAMRARSKAKADEHGG